MLDGRPLVDAHQHPVRLPTVKRAWLDWAERYGQPGWRDAYGSDGAVIPQALDDLMRAEGVDHALVICEYSPKATGMQPAEDLLPLVRHNPGRFSLIANVNPHLHYPAREELAPARPGRDRTQGAPGARRIQPRRPGALPRLPGLRRAGPAGGRALRYEHVPRQLERAGRPGAAHPGAAGLPRADRGARARRAGLVVRRRGGAGAAARERVDRAVRAAAAPPRRL